MPWVSRAQAGYMHIHHPEIAKEFDAATPAGAYKKLPYHVGDKGRRKKKPEHDAPPAKAAATLALFAKLGICKRAGSGPRGGMAPAAPAPAAPPLQAPSGSSLVGPLFGAAGQAASRLSVPGALSQATQFGTNAFHGVQAFRQAGLFNPAVPPR